MYSAYPSNPMNDYHTMVIDVADHSNLMNEYFAAFFWPVW